MICPACKSPYVEVASEWVVCEQATYRCLQCHRAWMGRAEPRTAPIPQPSKQAYSKESGK